METTSNNIFYSEMDTHNPNSFTTNNRYIASLDDNMNIINDYEVTSPNKMAAFDYRIQELFDNQSKYNL